MNRNIALFAATVAVSAIVSGVSTASVLTGFSISEIFGPAAPATTLELPGMQPPGLPTMGVQGMYPGAPMGGFGTKTSDVVGAFNSVGLGAGVTTGGSVDGSSCVSPSSLQAILDQLHSVEAALEQAIDTNDSATPINNTPCEDRDAGEACNQDSISVGCTGTQTCRQVGIGSKCKCGGN